MFNSNKIVSLILILVFLFSCDREKENSFALKARSTNKFILDFKVGMSEDDVNTHIKKLLLDKELTPIGTAYQFNLNIDNTIYYCKFDHNKSLGTFENNKLCQMSFSIDSCSTGFLKNGYAIFNLYESKYGKGKRKGEKDDAYSKFFKDSTYIWNLDSIRILLNFLTVEYEAANHDVLWYNLLKTEISVYYYDINYARKLDRIDSIGMELNRQNYEKEQLDKYKKEEEDRIKELNKI